jgi:hypothetical protein
LEQCFGYGIRIGSGFNQVSGSGFELRIRKVEKKEISCFDVLDGGLKASPVAWNYGNNYTGTGTFL